MKKLTFTALGLLASALGFGQTFSTGPIQFFPEYTVTVDVTADLVTLTQIMPDDRWYSLAFDNSSMNSGDIVAYINTANISDRQLGGFFVPPADAVQSWTTTSDDVTNGVRTVISTRALDTGEPGDFVFSPSATSINLACSRAGSASFSLSAHGGIANAVRTGTFGLTLGNAEFEKRSFSISPNPAKDAVIIEMPQEVTSEGELKIYDYLGRVVKRVSINESISTINVTDLASGNYLIFIRTDFGNSSQKLLVN